ncbi:MAG: PGPGW domain-containing protein [Nitrospiraceae bacterium]
MDALLAMVEQYVSGPTLLWMAGVSLVMFVGTLIAIPVILVRLPPNYFDGDTPHDMFHGWPPLLSGLAHVVKNLVGLIFLLAGFAMLFLPGQGLLTMLIGISLMDFPGKRALERKMIGQPAILSTINKMREKFGAPPLVIS